MCSSKNGAVYFLPYFASPREWQMRSMPNSGCPRRALVPWQRLGEGPGHSILYVIQTYGAVTVEFEAAIKLLWGVLPNQQETTIPKLIQQIASWASHGNGFQFFQRLAARTIDWGSKQTTLQNDFMSRVVLLK